VEYFADKKMSAKTSKGKFSLENLEDVVVSPDNPKVFWVNTKERNYQFRVPKDSEETTQEWINAFLACKTVGSSSFTSTPSSSSFTSPSPIGARPPRPVSVNLDSRDSQSQLDKDIRAFQALVEKKEKDNNSLHEQLEKKDKDLNALRALSEKKEKDVTSLRDQLDMEKAQLEKKREGVEQCTDTIREKREG